MSEFLAIGDLHLTASTGKGGLVGGLSAYIKDPDDFVINLVINQPLKYAKKRGIVNIILLGDIGERTRLSYEATLALIRLLKTPTFKFHIILGNHDLFGADPEQGHSMQIIKEMRLPNVFLYEKVTDVTIAGADFRFLPWPHSNFHKDRLNIAHIDVDGVKSDSGRVMTGDKMPRSKSMAVIGHVHTNQQVRNSHYTGTLYQTNFGEHPDKFFHHILHNAGEFEITNVPVKPVYKLHTVEITSKKDLKCIPASEHDLVKLILMPGCTAGPDDWKHLNVKRIRPTTTERDLALARVEDLNSGSEIEISTDEFFKEWLRNVQVDADLKSRAYKLRRKILNREEVLTVPKRKGERYNSTKEGQQE